MLRVNLGPRSYDIAIGTATSADLGLFLRDRLPKTRQALLVSDSNTLSCATGIIHALESIPWATTTAVIPAGESSKCLSQAEKLYDALAGINADRHCAVVAVGGGVVGDLAGFAAATWNRGIPLVMVPTSLLAMVDSSVGGKVGLNHPLGKNLIGAFHQPAGVWIDTATLDTLPDREYRSGLAEVVKYGVILDAELFTWLEENAAALLHRNPQALRHTIERSCQLKAEVVEKDEREETGLRMILNYGHTFAHAFESVGGYGSWLHGEAVAAGMVCASRLAERLCMIPAEITLRQVALLRKFGLPTAPLDWPTASLIASMRRDKKSLAGQLRFIVPTKLGAVTLREQVSDDVVADVLVFRE